MPYYVVYEVLCYYLPELPPPCPTPHPTPVFALNRRVNALKEAPPVIESLIPYGH